MNETKTKVYVIEVCGTDIYDSWEFHSVYADKAVAEEYACLLRNKKFNYDSVVVSEVTLN